MVHGTSQMTVVLFPQAPATTVGARRYLEQVPTPPLIPQRGLPRGPCPDVGIRTHLGKPSTSPCLSLFICKMGIPLGLAGASAHKHLIKPKRPGSDGPASALRTSLPGVHMCISTVCVHLTWGAGKIWETFRHNEAQRRCSDTRMK